VRVPVEIGKNFECDILRQSHPRLVLRFRMAPYLTLNLYTMEMLKVTKVGSSLKASRTQAPHYFIVESSELREMDETVGSLIVKQPVQFVKSFFVWSSQPWDIEVGTELPADRLAAVFGLKF